MGKLHRILLQSVIFEFEEGDVQINSGMGFVWNFRDHWFVRQIVMVETWMPDAPDQVLRVRFPHDRYFVQPCLQPKLITSSCPVIVEGVTDTVVLNSSEDCFPEPQQSTLSYVHFQLSLWDVQKIPKKAEKEANKAPRVVEGGEKGKSSSLFCVILLFIVLFYAGTRRRRIIYHSLLNSENYLSFRLRAKIPLSPSLSLKVFKLDHLQT